MNHKQLPNGATFLASVVMVLAFSVQLAAQAPNLVKEVTQKQGAITWITYKTPTVPDDVCTLLSACSGPAAKVAALPPATIGGRKVGRALFLIQQKNQPALLLEHQVPGSEVYFFLLGPDGTLQKTAYLEQGKSFIVIANSLAQPKFQADMKDWQAWAAKLGASAEKPKEN